MSKISICVIATNGYKEFIPQLFEGIEKHFLANHEREIHLFTDEKREYQSAVKIIQHSIPSLKFPIATLYRYRMLTAIEYNSDFIYYLDADMSVCGIVGDEILGNVVGIRHPGYFNGGWGSKNVDRESKAYLPPNRWGKYFCGGVQGGQTDIFYEIMKCMDDDILIDENNGIMAEYHDESHWNKWLAYNPPTVELDCSYCMPESIQKRVAWGINHLEPKIIALEKDFKKFRE